MKIVLNSGDGKTVVGHANSYKNAHQIAVSVLEDEHGYAERLKRNDIYISRDRTEGKRQWKLRIITGSHGILSDISVEIIEE